MKKEESEDVRMQDEEGVVVESPNNHKADQQSPFNGLSGIKKEVVNDFDMDKTDILPDIRSLADHEGDFLKNINQSFGM